MEKIIEKNRMLLYAMAGGSALILVNEVLTLPVVMLCLLGSLALLIIIYGFQLTFRKVQTLDQLKKYTSAKLLNIIHKDEEFLQNAFNALKTSIYLLEKKQSIQVISMSSTTAGEGKSYVATNLAIMLAQTGKKILLIHMEETGEGWQIEQDEFFNMTEVSFGIYSQANPDIFEHMLHKSRTEYDHIIIDGRPVETGAEMLPVMRLADINLYIVRAGINKKHLLANADLLMKECGVQNLFVLLNGVKSGDGFGIHLTRGEVGQGESYHVVDNGDRYTRTLKACL